MVSYCRKCEGEIRFEITGPEYDTNTGVQAFMQESHGNSWECACEHTDEEIAALEDAAAREYIQHGPMPIEP